MKSVNLLFIITLIFIFFTQCKKDDPGNATEEDDLDYFLLRFENTDFDPTQKDYVWLTDYGDQVLGEQIIDNQTDFRVELGETKSFVFNYCINRKYYSKQSKDSIFSCSIYSYLDVSPSNWIFYDSPEIEQEYTYQINFKNTIAFQYFLCTYLFPHYSNWHVQGSYGDESDFQVEWTSPLDNIDIYFLYEDLKTYLYSKNLENNQLHQFDVSGLPALSSKPIEFYQVQDIQYWYYYIGGIEQKNNIDYYLWDFYTDNSDLSQEEPVEYPSEVYYPGEYQGDFETYLFCLGEDKTMIHFEIGDIPSKMEVINEDINIINPSQDGFKVSFNHHNKTLYKTHWTLQGNDTLRINWYVYAPLHINNYKLPKLAQGLKDRYLSKISKEDLVLGNITQYIYDTDMSYKAYLIKQFCYPTDNYRFYNKYLSVKENLPYNGKHSKDPQDILSDIKQSKMLLHKRSNYMSETDCLE